MFTPRNNNLFIASLYIYNRKQRCTEARFLVFQNIGFAETMRCGRFGTPQGHPSPTVIGKCATGQI